MKKNELKEKGNIKSSFNYFKNFNFDKSYNILDVGCNYGTLVNKIFKTDILIVMAWI